ncbi:MAG: L-threonylcarbamoyladenylate synthase [Armatimonadota bacterium]
MAHRLTVSIERPGEMDCALDHAAAALRSGELIVIPTDTVYGLACATSDAEAVKRIFEVKRREATMPLPVLVGRRQDVTQMAANAPDALKTLGARHWPGPLTIIVPKSEAISDVLTGGYPTVGLRMPDHPVTLRLLRRSGPLAATSANISGHPAPVTVHDIEQEILDDVSIVIDAGPCPVGQASTVLDLTQTPPAILRQGSISAETIEADLQTTVSVRVTDDSQEDE